MVVRNVLVALKPGVDRDEYERFWRQVDHPTTTSLRSVASYRLERMGGAIPGLANGSWDYLERFEITDRAAFEEEAPAVGKTLVEELYARFLDRSRTVVWWSEPVAR